MKNKIKKLLKSLTLGLIKAKKNSAGQAIVEYILVIAVTLAIIIGFGLQFSDSMSQFFTKTFGSDGYFECLLQTGQFSNPSCEKVEFSFEPNSSPTIKDKFQSPDKFESPDKFSTTNPTTQIDPTEQKIAFKAKVPFRQKNPYYGKSPTKRYQPKAYSTDGGLGNIGRPKISGSSSSLNSSSDTSSNRSSGSSNFGASSRKRRPSGALNTGSYIAGKPPKKFNKPTIKSKAPVVKKDPPPPKLKTANRSKSEINQYRRNLNFQPTVSNLKDDSTQVTKYNWMDFMGKGFRTFLIIIILGAILLFMLGQLRALKKGWTN